VSDSFDVAICGYGPGAQTLAALLGRRGRRVIAFERYPHLYNLPRAGHIDHEAMRMVQSVGDVGPLLETLWEVRDEYVWLNQHGDLLMLQPAGESVDAVSGYFSDFSMWQPNLEAALAGAAADAGVEVRLGWEVVGLEQAEDHVTLTARERDGEQMTVRALFAVGADGANSYVREALGVEREDLGFNERWLVADMETKRELAYTPNIAQICDPGRPRMLMPLGVAHRRFEWMIHPDEATEDFERPDKAWELLSEFDVSPQTHAVARQAVYRFEARMAQRWRDRRVFLSGDAAHTMPPFAGQGLLSSMRDSNNLAWKLDLVLRGLAPDRLLDSYEAERRPHVRAWTEISMAEGAVSCETDVERAAERDRMLLSGAELPHARQPSLVTGLLSRDGGPLAGTLGLQGRVRVGDREGLFDDLLGSSRFTVVGYDADPAAALSDRRRAALARLDAIVVRIASSGGPDDVVDATGAYGTYFRDHGVVAVVSRPDFYVFGAVNELSRLEDLIDELLEELHA
jgi:2-polyprenyl-6-methoxyphenol hydroxylase-like FAD-dependent oxidoreductase